MTQRLMLLCATLVALAGESAYGVGLGELELNSALNQKLDAEIQLTNVGNLDSDEILPNLASQTDFERAGVERSYTLMDLRFNVDTDDQGDPVIKVTSTEPVVEPYLNFILEVLWPSGRLLREYTVLLDPPVFGEQGVEPIRLGETERPARQETPRETEPTPRQAESEPRRTRDQRMTEEGQLSDNEYGMTGPGDTLWAIALKVRPDSSVSVQQTMLAIQRANPEAFINNNINLLKAGHVLRVPDLDEIRSQGRDDAISSVQQHNDEFETWRDSGGDLAQLDASRRQQSGSSEAAQDPGELRLLANEQESDDGSGAGGGSERRAELEADLAVTKEDLDRANRANAELDSRIADLESQIEDLESLIEAKDNQLATLQDQLRKRMEQGDTEEPVQPVSRDDGASALMMNPFVLGGIGLLLVGGLAGGMVYTRKKRQSTALEDESFDDVTLGEDSGDVAIMATEQESDEVDTEEIDEELAPQTSDVISEAEIYIAYGRFPQAITFLQNAIEAEPDRTDLHLKLMEVYVQTEDATAFNLQYEKLKELGDEDAIARGAELQKKIPGAAETAEAAMGATVVSSEPVAAPAEDDDDELSFDLDDLDSETDEDELDLSSDPGEEDDSDELDLDLDEDTPSEGEAEVSGLEASPDETTDDDEFDLSLDDDLDLDLDTGEETGTDDTSDDEFTLDEADSDFSLDEDAVASVEDDTKAGDNEYTLGDDDTELNLEDDEFSLDDDDTELNLEDDEFSLDDDDTELNLEDDEFTLDDDDTELNLDDEEFSLDDDEELDLGEVDASGGDAGEDAGTKLDLARAYIDMGDNDGARGVLQQVVKEGSDSEIKQANELLENID